MIQAAVGIWAVQAAYGQSVQASSGARHSVGRIECLGLPEMDLVRGHADIDVMMVLIVTFEELSVDGADLFDGFEVV